MSAAPDYIPFARSIDWTKPDEINAEGKRIFNVRCKVPLPSIPQLAARVEAVQRDTNGKALDLAEMAADMGVELRDFHDIGNNGDSSEHLVDGEGEDAERLNASLPLISGIASSTSVDFFGTEMSTRALKMMAVQMMRAGGLAYIPRHNRGLAGGIEWDEVIGRTVHAEVVPTEQAAKPYNESEAQWLLRVTIQLYDNEPAAENLLRRIERGESIGQSIGGWFTNLQIIQNEDGDVERVIVLGVELDHLAVTRAPANPDSVGLVQLRSALDQSAADHRAATLVEHLAGGSKLVVTKGIAAALDRLIATDTCPLQTRHVVASVSTENTVVYQYLKGGAQVEDLEPGELITDDNAEGRTTEPAAENRDAAEPAVSDVADPAASDVADRAADQPEDQVVPSLDTTPATGDDASATDARRSALPDELSPATVDVATSEEPAMSADITLDAIRSLMDDAVKPLTQRLDDIDTERSALQTAEATTVVDEPTPEPTVDERVATAERNAEAAMTRAATAEAALVVANQRPMRQGRSVVPNIGAGPMAATGFGHLVEECRSAAPTLAAVAERCVPLAAETDLASFGDAGRQRSALYANLTALMNAAETDGIITDPNHRTAWQ